MKVAYLAMVFALYCIAAIGGTASNYTLYIPNPPGGETDKLMSALRPYLENATHSKWNWVYATGNIGADSITDMLTHPDAQAGFALAVANLPHLFMFTLELSVPWQDSDVVPVFYNSYNPVALLSQQYSTLESLLAAAAALPDGQYLYVGGPQFWSANYIVHLALQHSDPRALKLKFVDCASNTGALNKLLSGNVTASYTGLGTAVYRPAGINVLGVSSDFPVPDLPDAPLFKTMGIVASMAIYRGIVCSSKVSEARRAELASLFNTVGHNSDALRAMRSLGFWVTNIMYPDTLQLTTSEKAHAMSIVYPPKPSGSDTWVIIVSVALPIAAIVTLILAAFVITILWLNHKRTLLMKENALLKVTISPDALDTPAGRVLAILDRVGQRQCLPREDREDLLFAYQVIASGKLDKLSSIKLKDGEDDQEVEDFLKNTVLSSAANTTTLSLPALLGEFSEDSLSSIPDSGNADSPDQTSLSAKSLDSWDFDAITLRETSFKSDRAFMYWTASHAMGGFGLFGKFGIDARVFQSFVNAICDSYKGNPYHNAIHACDVTQSLYWILSHCNNESRLSDVEILAMIFSGLIHDVGHPGRNQAFLIAVNDELSTTYNDRSILENMHLSKAFQILAKPECNFLITLSPQLFSAFRKTVIELVLATDMTHHVELLSEFKARATSAGGFERTDDRMLLLRMIMKCSDIFNTARPWPITEKWAGSAVEEFFQQGDEEKKRGLPVSPLMDRITASIPKMQASFIDYVVLPLATSVQSICPQLKEAVDNLKLNSEEWRKQRMFEKKMGIHASPNIISCLASPATGLGTSGRKQNAESSQL